VVNVNHRIRTTLQYCSWKWAHATTIQTTHRPPTYSRDGKGQSLTSVRLSLKQIFLIVSNTTQLNHAACNLSWATYLTAFK
jgi:hypothetical protein